VCGDYVDVVLSSVTFTVCVPRALSCGRCSAWNSRLERYCFVSRKFSQENYAKSGGINMINTGFTNSS